jgi:hypothetical protein
MDSNDTVLFAYDPDFSGVADIDGDGTVDIRWQ